MMIKITLACSTGTSGASGKKTALLQLLELKRHMEAKTSKEESQRVG